MAALRCHTSPIQQEVYSKSCSLTFICSHHHVWLSSTATTCAFCCRCRLDAEAKTNQLAELSASKASLEHELATLTDSHAALTQQHQALLEQISRVQGSLTASEEAKAAAEVCLTSQKQHPHNYVLICRLWQAMQLSHIFCRKCEAVKL